MSETINLGHSGGLILGDVEEDACTVVADKANALKIATFVWLGDMSGLFDAEACGDGTNGEGGDGIKHQVFVEVKSMGVAG